MVEKRAECLDVWMVESMVALMAVWKAETKDLKGSQKDGWMVESMVALMVVLRVEKMVEKDL